MTISQVGRFRHAAVGVVRWTTQYRDMPVAGTYTATLTIKCEAGRVLIIDGKYSVE